MRTFTCLLVLYVLSFPVHAAESNVPLNAGRPTDFQTLYSRQAAQENPAYSGPSAVSGQQFFQSRHGKEWSCSSCHTNAPTASGKHKVTGKTIEPMAPSANPARFTNARKVERWFKRNCGDVLGRGCSAQEKADVLAYLTSLR